MREHVIISVDDDIATPIANRRDDRKDVLFTMLNHNPVWIDLSREKGLAGRSGNPDVGSARGHGEMRLPPKLVGTVVLVSALPALLNLFGFEFGSEAHQVTPSTLMEMDAATFTDSLFYMLSGAFTHTLLEWSAFCVASFTVLLAIVRFSINRDSATSIIALSLFAAACMDAFHTLAADRLVESIADNRNLIPFTWAACRVFNVTISIVGIIIFLIRKQKRTEGGIGTLLGSGAFFAVLAYLVIRYCANSTSLPETMYPEALITRPWDVAPLILYAIAGVFVYPRFHRMAGSIFSHSLIVSAIPHLATQAHMAFGSSALFDNHFNIAHFLKVVAYLVPLMGLCLDYIYSAREQMLTVQKLDQKVMERTKKLRDSLAELRESEARAEVVLEEAGDGIVTINERGIIQSFNGTAERLFGYSKDEAIGHNVSMLVPSPHGENHDEYLARYLRTGEEHILNSYRELDAQRKDGSLFPISLGISEIRLDDRLLFTGIVRDLSQHKVLEAQLNQAQKLESIGQLAAGIAHEINTPIQFVGDNTRFIGDVFNDLAELFDALEELVEMADQDEIENCPVVKAREAARQIDLAFMMEEVPKAVEQSLDGIDRVAKIVRAMKDFSHPGSEERQVLDINHSITSTVTISRNEWKYVSDLETDLDPLLPQVFGLPQEFNQVILNLIVNAAHAIAETLNDTVEGKGLISISTRLVGDRAEIRISDTGCGIPDSIRHKIFDPFFTTKEVGKGTGQGLALAHAVIVDKHGGTMHVENGQGRGTTFVIGLKTSSDEIAVRGPLR